MLFRFTQGWVLGQKLVNTNPTPHPNRITRRIVTLPNSRESISVDPKIWTNLHLIVKWEINLNFDEYFRYWYQTCSKYNRLEISIFINSSIRFELVLLYSRPFKLRNFQNRWFDTTIQADFAQTTSMLNTNSLPLRKKCTTKNQRTTLILRVVDFKWITDVQ